MCLYLYISVPMSISVSVSIIEKKRKTERPWHQYLTKYPNEGTLSHLGDNKVKKKSRNGNPSTSDILKTAPKNYCDCVKRAVLCCQTCSTK